MHSNLLSLLSIGYVICIINVVVQAKVAGLNMYRVRILNNKIKIKNYYKLQDSLLIIIGIENKRGIS